MAKRQSSPSVSWFSSNPRRKRAGPGGIIIPDSAKEKPQEAKVHPAVGTGKERRGRQGLPFEVKGRRPRADSKYGGTEVKIEEKKYTIVREDDISACSPESCRESP